MISVRLVSTIDKEGSTYTLGTIKLVIEDVVNHRQLTVTKEINTVQSNVTALFAAIQQATTDAVTSSLIT